jgi:signal transduction histidine kinase
MCRGAGTDELLERDHELRAALFGIEAAAVALSEQRDHLTSADVDQLALAIASEARRLRLMLDARSKQRGTFDLAAAIRPAILMARSMGVVVRDWVPAGMSAQGCREDAGQVVFALLDNARLHAAGSAIDVRLSFGADTTTLHVEDRGVGIGAALGAEVFERGRYGPESSGSGLGLYVARRLMVDQAGSLTLDQRPGGGTSFALTFRSSPSDSSERLGPVALQSAVVS